jgi:hypothetical protein
MIYWATESIDSSFLTYYDYAKHSTLVVERNSKAAPARVFAGGAYSGAPMGDGTFLATTGKPQRFENDFRVGIGGCHLPLRGNDQ